MAQDPSPASTPVDEEPKSPAELRGEIEETREELGDTAAALAAKTDVKTRARQKVEDVKQSVSEKNQSAAVTDLKAKATQNPTTTAAIAAFLGGYVIGRLRSR